MTQEYRQYFKRIAAYAYSDNHKEMEGFYMGEGLVGQCALEKQTILLKQVPKDYINIRSGTGEGHQEILLSYLYNLKKRY